MASVSSVSSSSASSIYGNRNIFSGLASGMDTEAMIENSVLGIKTKIQSLIQQQTKIIWKQDAMRSITDKLAALSEKYASYTSTTNLGSRGFFDNAIITSAQGANASKVAATGKSTSDIEINAIQSLATSSRYSVDVSKLNYNATALKTETDDIDWTQSFQASNVTGSITLAYNQSKVTLDITDDDDVPTTVEGLAALIERKLAAQSEVGGIAVAVNGRQINFNDRDHTGANITIVSASGKIQKTLGIANNATSITVPPNNNNDNVLYSDQSFADYMEGKKVDVTLDGVTKQVTMGKIDPSSQVPKNEQFAAMLQGAIDGAFGANKITVSASADGKRLGFEATPGSGSTFSIKPTSTTVSQGLGMSTYGISNYMDGDKTLGSILGLDYFYKNGNIMKGEGIVSWNSEQQSYLDSAGNKVDRNGNRVDSFGRAIYGADLVINGVKVGTYTSDTNFQAVLSDISSSDAGVTATYSKLTNKLVFTTKDTGEGTGITFGDGADGDSLAADLFTVKNPRTTDDGILLDKDGNRVTGTLYTLNTNGDMVPAWQYNIRYDKVSGKYYRTNLDGTDIVSNSNGDKVEEKDLSLIKKGIAQDMTNYIPGQDAVLSVTVNGDEMELRRSSNTIDMDGMTVTLKGTFGYKEIKDANGNVTGLERDESAEPITFNTEADADKIVDTVKSFVEAFNEIMKETHDAFATLPEKKTGSTRNNYEPLTDEDKEGMSDAEIARYEEKAKIGILFNDSDLRSLYNSLRDAITPGGESRKLMESIGITTEYASGVTTLKLDEEKLRSVLASDPEQVQNVFSRSTANGAKTDGLIPTLKKTMDKYVSLSIVSPGVLVKKAGTKLSALSLSNNLWQDQLNGLDTQIDKWQTKMSNQIDYYTKLFTRMEQLISEMNSQSSALASLTMGGEY